MTTTKTRAQIAESLREDAEKEHLDELSDGELLDALEIDLGLGAYKDGYEAELFRALADLIAPQLPDGIEWPRFEDGELVGIGDEVDGDGETMTARNVTLSATGWTLTLDSNDTVAVLSGASGERVKRPKPRILDVDGVPIEVGDTAYTIEDGRKVEVTGIYGDGAVAIVDSDGLITVRTSGECLSHERPDSWEQLEEDAKLIPSNYVEKCGLACLVTRNFETMTRDLVRRAKALAKAGE